MTEKCQIESLGPGLGYSSLWGCKTHPDCAILETDGIKPDECSEADPKGWA